MSKADSVVTWLAYVILYGWVASVITRASHASSLAIATVFGTTCVRRDGVGQEVRSGGGSGGACVSDVVGVARLEVYYEKKQYFALVKSNGGCCLTQLYYAHSRSY